MGVAADFVDDVAVAPKRSAPRMTALTSPRAMRNGLADSTTRRRWRRLGGFHCSGFPEPVGHRFRERSKILNGDHCDSRSPTSRFGRTSLLRRDGRSSQLSSHSPASVGAQGCPPRLPRSGHGQSRPPPDAGGQTSKACEGLRPPRVQIPPPPPQARTPSRPTGMAGRFSRRTDGSSTPAARAARNSSSLPKT